ncbi:MAG TPA: hypothetical protein VNI83_08980 [Vicinamibacterales bacterium]|nr:hypothetical protein [Vicinamibacterales bacterium]
MVWFFTRETEMARYEVRRPDAGAYELVVTRLADGRTVQREVEAFENPTALIERTLARQRAYLQEGWQPQPAVGFFFRAAAPSIG